MWGVKACPLSVVGLAIVVLPSCSNLPNLKSRSEAHSGVKHAAAYLSYLIDLNAPYSELRTALNDSATKTFCSEAGNCQFTHDYPLPDGGPRKIVIQTLLDVPRNQEPICHDLTKQLECQFNLSAQILNGDLSDVGGCIHKDSLRADVFQKWNWRRAYNRNEQSVSVFMNTNNVRRLLFIRSNRNTSCIISLSIIIDNS
jgi:hypothetical protein